MNQPNIIFYFSDQQRADTCGCYGQELPISPRLDEMAEEGIRFDMAFSPQPVCGPCRSVFQTGLYPTETGCFRNNIALPEQTKTLAQYMEGGGYETAYVGKWHLASDGLMEGVPTRNYHDAPIPPEHRGGYTGFWRVSDVLEFTSDGYGGHVFDEHMRKIDFQGYRADCITDFALEFLNNRDNKKPFFLTVSQLEPHHQNSAHHYQGPKDSKKRFENFTLPEDLAALGGDALEEYPDYLGACERVDFNLGRIIDALKAQGIYEDTIIIFTSDHGSHFRTRNQDQRMNGYDDYKRSCHDAVMRIPLVIRGGDYVGGNVVTDLVSTAGMTKTILAMAGIQGEAGIIGENLHDVALKRIPDRNNEVYAQISESRVGRVIRTPEFTYSVYAPGKDGGSYLDSDEYCDDFLYDLKKDPYQLKNLIHDQSYDQQKEILREKLLQWIYEVEGKRPVIRETREYQEV